MIPLLVLIATYLSVSSARGCGGVQNRYVCHPSNPRQFMICIGDQQYTMKCPGNLHFSTKTQTCDWPRNADCGRPPIRIVTQPTHRSQPTQRGGYTNRRQPSYTWRKNRNPYINRAASKERKGEPINAVAALSGPRQFKNPSDRERNVADTPTQKNQKNQNYDYKDTRTLGTSVNDSKDKWTLAHYPWWAAKSATPANIKARLSRRPVTPTPSYMSRSPFVQRKSRTHRIRYNPIKSSVGRAPVNSAASRDGPKAKILKKALPPVMNDADPPTKAPKKKPIIRKPGKCNPSTCQLPDCRCIGKDIPGGIPVTQTPMMVMLTFDDSVNNNNYYYFQKLFDGRFRNPNGCGVKGTFFVSGNATQYHLVEKLYKNGQEIASHSQSHRLPKPWWSHAGYEAYVHEFEGMRKRLSKNSNIPKDEIKGMRVPFLQIGGDGQYQMLKDYKFLYDTTMVTRRGYKERPIWPFTLDYPPDFKTCSHTPCPQGSYPGLWEVPLIHWFGTNRGHCWMPESCVTGPERKGTLKHLQNNFNHHYTTNRSPLGVFLHAHWFPKKNGSFEGLLDFLDELSGMKDVWVISVSQVLDWVRHPKPLSQINSIESWKC